MANWKLFQADTNNEPLFKTQKENFVEFSNALKRVVIERIEQVYFLSKRCYNTANTVLLRLNAGGVY